jgi:hypothetical protein
MSLDADTRASARSFFGHSFADVRVHTGPKAAATSAALGASAYTVGHHVVFAAGEYAPATRRGARLLVHELVHVVQQSATAGGTEPDRVSDPGDPGEVEADWLADAFLSETVLPPGFRPETGGPVRPEAPGHLRPVRRAQAGVVLRHPRDLVGYTGGQSGTLAVLDAGSLAYRAPAVSGHPGHGQHEVGEGPIPGGTYTLHPRVTQRPVTTLQGGVCGANAIPSGYQDVISTEPSPCSGAHYCNVPCPTTADPARKCFTPQDCWGSHRIKIEGATIVTTPTGGTVRRSGFFIHGGNAADAVSSGCIKTLDDGVFPEIRKLTGVRGAVPLCVGEACPWTLSAALVGAAVLDVLGALPL